MDFFFIVDFKRKFALSLLWPSFQLKADSLALVVIAVASLATATDSTDHSTNMRISY